jgi:hypothetical protein
LGHINSEKGKYDSGLKNIPHPCYMNQFLRGKSLLNAEYSAMPA